MEIRKEFGQTYVNRAIYAESWFLIGHKMLGNGNGRYLHTGNVSAGCITVKDIHKWNKLYLFLVKSRKKGDNRSVGQVRVINSKAVKSNRTR